MSEKSFLSSVLFRKKNTNETKGNKLIKDLFTIPKKNKGNDIRHYVKPDKKNEIHQSDLLFLPTDKFGYKYALVVVDIYDSRIDIEPLKLKSSVAHGLQKIYERGILHYPKYLYVDSGSEFKGDVLEFLNKHNVIVSVSATQRHTQTAFVERANFLIGKAIAILQTRKEIETNKTVKKWIDNIKLIVETINDKADTTKEKRENEIDDKKEKDKIILKEASKKNADDEVDELISNIKNKIQPNIIKYDIPLAGKNSKQLGILPEGTRVRIALDYPINHISGEKLHGTFRAGDIRFSKEIHTIEKIILSPNQPIAYLVSDIKNRSFLSNQLLKV